VVPATLGGTGISSYTIGDILYANTANSLSKLSDVATGNALVSGGVGTAPIWSKVGLTTHVNGVLPIANGGTGTSDGIMPLYVDTNTTVNGHKLTGNITLVKADVGLGNVTDESKSTMFTNAALTGTPTAPTASEGTNTTQIATTAFVLANSSDGSTVIDTTGLEAFQVAFYRDTATIGGDPEFTYTPQTSLQAQIDGGSGFIIVPTYFKAFGPSGTELTMYNSTVEINGDVILYDSTYLMYAPTSGSTRFSGVSHTNALYPDSTRNAGGMFRKKNLPTIKQSLDTVDSEVIWYVFDEKGNEFQYRGIEKIPSLGLQIHALMGGIEQNRIYIRQLEQRIEVLEGQTISDNSEWFARQNKVNTILIVVIAVSLILSLVVLIKKDK